MYQFQRAIGYNPGLITKDELIEQLNIISHKGFKLLQLFGDLETSKHIVEIIEEKQFDLTVFLGIQFLPELIDQEAEPSKVLKTKDVILNKKENQKNLESLIVLAKSYSHIIKYISVGYMNLANYDTHIISKAELSKYVKRVKQNVPQKVTYSDDFYIWNTQLEDFIHIVDFVSISLFPYSQEKYDENAFNYALLVYEASKENLSGVDIVIGQTGYPAMDNANISIKEKQRTYNESMISWAQNQNILVVFYEAFSKPYVKGSQLNNYGII